MPNNELHRYNPHWVPVDFGTPSKEVTKVLVKTKDGTITECTYSRHNRTWATTESGKILTDVKAWALLPDSIPQRRTT